MVLLLLWSGKHTIITIISVYQRLTNLVQTFSSNERALAVVLMQFLRGLGTLHHYDVGKFQTYFLMFGERYLYLYVRDL